MKATGMVRKVDELGRIVLPAEIRQLMNINVKDPIEIYTEADRIILKKYQQTCIFCGADESLVEFKDKRVCQNCLQTLKNEL
ncbi:MAG: AbrB/MazE/SpoVT family DNA-binding domain-containing protein [Ruminococcaceae bacterium]|nr:AbrB/MazE/SpoVT family DNA-binding domain-containing protein [Oscillospiraceae bacterium]